MAELGAKWVYAGRLSAISSWAQQDLNSALTELVNSTALDNAIKGDCLRHAVRVADTEDDALILSVVIGLDDPELRARFEVSRGVIAARLRAARSETIQQIAAEPDEMIRGQALSSLHPVMEASSERVEMMDDLAATSDFPGKVGNIAFAARTWMRADLNAALTWVGGGGRPRSARPDH